MKNHPLLRSRHCVELLLAGQRILLLFPLALDSGLFLQELSQCRASLEGLKMVPLPAQKQQTSGKNLMHISM